MELHWLTKSKTWMNSNKEVLLAGVLTTLLVLSMVSLNLIDSIVAKSGVSSTFWIIGIIAVNIGSIAALGYLSGVGKGERFLLVATLSTFVMYIFLYYLRLSDSSVTMLGLTLSSRITASLAIIAIYAVTIYYLMRHEVLPFFLRAAVAFVIILSNFAFFSWVENNTNTLISQDFLRILINSFNVVPWLIFTSITLSFVSRADLNFRVLKDELPILANLAGWFLMVLIAVYFLSISLYGSVNLFYWQQSLITFIAWDFIYKYVRIMYDEENTTKGFIESSSDLAYYVVLFLAVLFSPYIINIASLF